jgi:hypothetical protein
MVSGSVLEKIHPTRLERREMNMKKNVSRSGARKNLLLLVTANLLAVVVTFMVYEIYTFSWWIASVFGAPLVVISSFFLWYTSEHVNVLGRSHKMRLFVKSRFLSISIWLEENRLRALKSSGLIRRFLISGRRPPDC